MLKRLHVRNFTVFADAEFEFSPGLNVIVGTNGTGKSHVLKLGYAVELAYALIPRGPRDKPFSAARIKAYPIAYNILNQLDEVFLPKGLGKLIRHTDDTDALLSKAEIKAQFGNTGADSLEFAILDEEPSVTNSVSMPETATIAERVDNPVFIPAKEVLSLMPDIVGLSDTYTDLFDLTYTGLARRLLSPLLKTIPPYAEPVISRLGLLLGGTIKAENGRFYLLDQKGNRTEINLLAEGYRKIGALAYLLANGSLSKTTTLYWDEVEANLNNALLREVARLLIELANAGFQIILATHSLFLLKELHILSRRAKAKPVRYFGLFAGPEGDTQVETTDDFELLQHITALDAELTQTFDYEETLDQDAAADADDTRG